MSPTPGKRHMPKQVSKTTSKEEDMDEYLPTVKVTCPEKVYYGYILWYPPMDTPNKRALVHSYLTEDYDLVPVEWITAL